MKKNGPWEITSSEVKYQNSWMSVREDKVIQLDGSPGLFGVVTMTPGATVLALDNQDNAYLIREYRYALERYSVEGASGGIEPGETPLEAAKRELKEETGLSSDHWTDLGELDPFTAIIDSRDHMFLAEDVQVGEQNLEPHENIEVLKVPFAKAVDMALQGEITHGASVAAILKANLMRNQHGERVK